MERDKIHNYRVSLSHILSIHAVTQKVVFTSSLILLVDWPRGQAAAIACTETKPDVYYHHKRFLFGHSIVMPLSSSYFFVENGDGMISIMVK